MKAEAPLYPEDKERGTRKFSTKGEFYINEDDFSEIKRLKAKYFRLMHLFNVEIKGSKFLYHSTEVDEKLKAKIIHWLPADSENLKKLVKAEILMPDIKIIKGFAEQDISKQKVDDIIQFERFGFCRLDAIDKKKTCKFWFTQK